MNYVYLATAFAVFAVIARRMISESRKPVEYFTADGPAVSGSRSQTMSVKSISIALAPIGVSDHANFKISTLDSSTSSAQAVVPMAEPLSELAGLVGYESMFDTRLPGANAQPNTRVINSAPRGIMPGDSPLDARGMHPFSDLVSCSQRNYLTAQNFYEYSYRYPLIMPEGIGPLGANYANSAQLQNPEVSPGIIGANRDGGAPLPQNTFFRSI